MLLIKRVWKSFFPSKVACGLQQPRSLWGREEGRGATREASGICSYEQDQEKSSGKSSRCLFSLGTPRIGQLQPTYNYVFCKAKWPNLRLFSAASSSSWKNQQSINLLQLFCFSCCDSVICSKALLVREGPHNNSLMPFPIRLFPPFCWQMRRRASLSFQVQHFCLHNGINQAKNVPIGEREVYSYSYTLLIQGSNTTSIIT